VAQIMALIWAKFGNHAGSIMVPCFTTCLGPNLAALSGPSQPGISGPSVAQISNVYWEIIDSHYVV